MIQVGPRHVVCVSQPGSKLGSLAATLGIGYGSQNSSVSDQAEETKDHEENHDSDDDPDDPSGATHVHPLLSMVATLHSIRPRG
ncbi:MAG: hypothetical protein ABJB39_02115 [Chloroflexota bacterium]